MIAVNAQYCPQNHPCPVVQFCPAGAIDQDGFAAPTVNAELCTDCGICTTMCAAFEVDDESSAA